MTHAPYFKDLKLGCAPYPIVILLLENPLSKDAEAILDFRSFG